MPGRHGSKTIRPYYFPGKSLYISVFCTVLLCVGAQKRIIVCTYGILDYYDADYKNLWLINI